MHFLRSRPSLPYYGLPLVPPHTIRRHRSDSSDNPGLCCRVSVASLLTLPLLRPRRLIRSDKITGLAGAAVTSYAAHPKTDLLTLVQKPSTHHMPDKEERIKILVSSKSESRRFTLNPNPVYASSAYLAREGAKSSQPNTQIRLNVADMDLFRMFLTWIKASRSKQNMDRLEEDIREEPWLSKTAHAWIFSAHLEAPEFSSFCLIAFMRNCALAPTGPWPLIETATLPSSPLQRFANHWVAWNASFLTGTTHEYVGLKAASHAQMVDAYTGDPREYDELHWYTHGCGDSLSPRCHHNPAFRRERERLANRPPKPYIDTEYGKDFELARKKDLNP